MSLIKELQDKKPDREVVFTAIENLTDKKQIKQFYSEYVAYLKQRIEREHIEKSPEIVADENIGYVLGYYDKKTADEWMETLPSVKHPVFGRFNF